MKLLSVIAILLTASMLFIAPSVEAKDPPPFPGQPHINAALRQLNAAKDKASTDATTALNDLQTVANNLAHASHNKGTYQNIARGLTEQAAIYLQKGDVEKALHKIDEAITAVTHAGETGEH